MIKNHVVIIGNGFDLNLGRKTSYKDFIQSDQFKELIQSKNSLCIDLNNQLQERNWVDIEMEFMLQVEKKEKESNSGLSICN